MSPTGQDQTSSSSASSFALEDAPAISDEIVDALPEMLREPAFFHASRHRRDIFLTGALGTISGCLPMYQGYYGEGVPGALGPNLYTAIVAPTAGGKGALKPSIGLAKKTKQFINEKTKQKYRAWKMRKEQTPPDESFDEPEPPRQGGLFLPADSSAAFLFRMLKKIGGRAILTSTEIDVMADAIGQDWGKFDAFLRLAYHHESKGYGRQGEGEAIWIQEPALAVVLSGTSRQLASLMDGSTENGLYNRFTLYYSSAVENWRSQRPSSKRIDQLNRLAEISERVRQIYKALSKRSEPLRFEMNVGAWEKRVRRFGILLRRARLSGDRALEGVVFRAGVWAFRITMILTALRAFERDARLSRASTLSAVEQDVEIGLSLAELYADHSLRYGSEKLSEDGDPRAERIRIMLEGVGEVFSSGEAYEAYRNALPKEERKGKRTLRKDLKQAADQGLTKAISANGQWKKTSPTEEYDRASIPASDWRDQFEPSEVSEKSEASLPKKVFAEANGQVNRGEDIPF